MWQFYLFGKYLGPIAVFPGRYQRELAALFKKAKPPPLAFGIGYRHRGYDSNLMLAVKKKTASSPAQESKAAQKPLHEATAAERKKKSQANTKE
jgi:hypothetical protein